MIKIFKRGTLFLSLALFAILAITDFADAGGLLGHNSGEQSGLRRQELDDAYYRGYNDAKSGREPIEYNSDGTAGRGAVVRNAGVGALGGAAIGNLSDGDTGKGAAWGAGVGAARGVVKRKRAQNEESNLAAELNNAYNSGYQKGMEENASSGAKGPAVK